MKYGNWQHDGSMVIPGKTMLTAPGIGLLDMPPKAGAGEIYCYTYLAFEAAGPCDLSMQIGVTNASDRDMPIWPYWGICHIQDTNMRREKITPVGDRHICRVERHDVIDPFRVYPSGYAQPPRQWQMKNGLSDPSNPPQFVAQIINNSNSPATIWNVIFWSKASWE